MRRRQRWGGGHSLTSRRSVSRCPYCALPPSELRRCVSSAPHVRRGRDRERRGAGPVVPSRLRSGPCLRVQGAPRSIVANLRSGSGLASAPLPGLSARGLARLLSAILACRILSWLRSPIWRIGLASKVQSHGEAAPHWTAGIAAGACRVRGCSLTACRQRALRLNRIGQAPMFRRHRVQRHLKCGSSPEAFPHSSQRAAAG